jgi:hypothetical protein
MRETASRRLLNWHGFGESLDPGEGARWDHEPIRCMAQSQAVVVAQIGNLRYRLCRTRDRLV